jgi:hypothetical protein
MEYVYILSSIFEGNVPFYLPPPLLMYQRISPGPRPCEMICKITGFYGEELLAPHPTPKLKNHPFLVVSDCLFDIFAASLHVGGCSSTCSLKTRSAMVTGTHL